MGRPEAQPDRWSARPGLSLLLRGAVLVVPVCAAVAAAFVVSVLPGPPGALLPPIVWWVVVLGSSMAALAVVDALARRLLPLAALLRLSMLFPDQAPSRYRVARRAGSVGALERQLALARELDEGAAPAAAGEIIITLVTALTVHDRRTRGHSERVHLYADMLGEELGLDEGDRERLRWAAMLHDIGKLHVHTDILNKPGAPDEQEWERIRQHPDLGRELIAPLVPWLGEWADAIDQHHERFDGKGYPRGLAGEAIARSARIVAVADSYEVMTAARAYKLPLGPAGARRELAACAGTQFDPAIVRAFLNISIGRLRRMAWPVAVGAVVPSVGRWAAASTAPTTAVAGVVGVGMILAGPGGLVGPAAGADPEPRGPIALVDDVEAPIPASERAADVPSRGPAGTPARAGQERLTVADGWRQVPRPAVVVPSPEPSADATPGFAGGGTPEPEQTAPTRTSGPVSTAAPPAATTPPRTGASGRTNGPGQPSRPPPAEEPAAAPRETTAEPDDQPADGPSGRAAPLAVDDVVRTDAGRLVRIDVLANDEHLQRDRAALRVIVAPELGTVRRNADLTLTYVPRRGAVGEDRFRYRVCHQGPGGGCGTATVTVEIIPPAR